MHVASEALCIGCWPSTSMHRAGTGMEILSGPTKKSHTSTIGAGDELTLAPAVSYTVSRVKSMCRHTTGPQGFSSQIINYTDVIVHTL